MEMGCPSCGQRLNIREGFKNPTCRCPSCQYVFRARDFGYGARLGTLESSSGSRGDRSYAPDIAKATVVEPRRDDPRVGRGRNAEPSTSVGDSTGDRSIPPRVYGRPSTNERMPKTNKVSWGTLFFIALIAARVLSKFWARPEPAPAPPPRNDLRAPVPVQRAWSRSERPAFPVQASAPLTVRAIAGVCGRPQSDPIARLPS